MKPLNSLFSHVPLTVFEEMSRLAISEGAINLGQGFPDEDGPQDLKDIAAEAIADGFNQYPPMMGLPALRQAVAAHNKRFYGVDVDPETEVMVTSGATEALNDCMMALIEPGDEVVVIEPLYDCYLPIIRRVGGIPKPVRVAPPNWALDVEELRAAFSPKTKLLLINSPQNPASKVFGAAELKAIADLLEEFDAYAVCDEVYEHMCFDERPHIPLMTLPGMRKRCVRIGSAGKTFSMTGWKVGYITACPDLLKVITKAHQWVTFTTPPALQAATAVGLAKDDAYFSGLRDEMQTKRDRLTAGLKGAGLDVVPCEGTYFLSVDIRSAGFNGTDVDFCKTITTQAGVAAIPLSAFYLDREDAPAVKHFARFCFAKREEVLDAAVEKLSGYLT